MNRLKHISLFLFVMLAYRSNAQQYNFRQYNVQDGLAHSQVSAILQDSKGYLWFTTYGGGLSRFDGKTFTNYTEKEGLPNNITRPIIEDKKGNFWIGTMGSGICWFDGKKFTRLKDSTTKINEKIYAIMQSSDGKIWFGADNGVYVYDGKKTIHYTEKDGLPEVPVMCIFQDSKGLIWIASWEKGVYCYDPAVPLNKKSLRQFTQEDGLSYHTLMSVNEDADGNIWFSTFKGVTKLEKRPDGSFYFYRSFTKDIDSNLIYSVLDDRKGNLWFASTQKGLIKYDKSKNTYTPIYSKNGLPGDIVLCTTMDREGNLWLSNWGLGAVEFSGERFLHYTEKEGLGSNIINSVVKDKSGGLLINTAKGIYRYRGNDHFELLDKQLANMTIFAIDVDEKGTLWVATAKALYSYANGKLKKYTEADGLHALPLTSVMCENGNVWMGSWSDGITCFDGKTFKNYSIKNGLGSNYVYTAYKSASGKIYIGTWDGGLCVKDGDKFTTFKKEQGLPGNNVISITEDRAGIIWLGTFGGGVCRYDPSVSGAKAFKIISSKDGLSDDAVVAMVFDNNENLFVATSKGLNKINVREYENTGQINIKCYGLEEGFTGIECNRNSVLKDTAGNLWFGTKKGLTRFNPKLDKENRSLPVIHITGLKLFFENTDWSAYCDSIDASNGLPYQLSLNYKNNHLTFNFIGISTTVPEKVRYRYILEGLDKDWSPPSDKTDATYSGLPPGDYTFKVIACNNEGIWEQRSAAFYSFSIAPPFWQRIWFYALCILVLLSGSYFYTKWKTKKLAEENKILEAKVVERTAKIEKQKDELQFAYGEIENKNVIVEQKNRDITDSINYAKRIQQAILPLEADIKEGLPESFVLFRPRDIVSGDFYWFAKISGKSILAVVDCTGHGVPGAFMSMIGNSLLNEIVYEKKIYEPAKILNLLDQGIRLSLKQDLENTKTHDGMDIALISIENNQLEYAGAHRPLYMIRTGALKEISADKFPIGGMRADDKRIFTNNVLELQKGDCLYLFTDGYVDQFGGEKGKKFMSKRFQELLLSIHDKSMEEQKNILDETMSSWKSRIEQVDDILVAGIRF